MATSTAACRAHAPISHTTRDHQRRRAQRQDARRQLLHRFEIKDGQTGGSARWERTQARVRADRSGLPLAAREIHDLLDALKRNAEQVGGIPDTEAQIVYETGNRVGGGRRGLRSNHREACTRAATPAYGGERVVRQSDVVDELGGVRAFDPERKSFTNATPCFDEAAAVAVTTRNRRDAGDPGAGLVALEHDAIAHRSHFFPRHGSRSRSMARSVPGGRSTPRWTGTVVWQRSQRIRTCDPFWRTTSHPSSLSLRRTCVGPADRSLVFMRQAY